MMNLKIKNKVMQGKRTEETPKGLVNGKKFKSRVGKTHP